MEITSEKKPLPIPRVRVIDPNGRKVCEGWYIAYPERMGYPVVAPDEKPDPIPLVEAVAFVQYGDWGMPNHVKILPVTPPYRIEIIEDNEGDPK